MCGATGCRDSSSNRGQGPSPRVRGNRGSASCDRAGTGPIPACAGQPALRWARFMGIWAHPRVCGATFATLRTMALDWGPSPRVRGNLFWTFEQLFSLGPIPACAGQPSLIAWGTFPPWAHPRVCGATLLNRVHACSAGGPSPRVRGNLSQAAPAAAQPGPIPACAGQPERSKMPPSAIKAHPRVCGATAVCCDGRQSEPGPSPRVRGNPHLKGRVTVPMGPIPACAGQPIKKSRKSS